MSFSAIAVKGWSTMIGYIAPYMGYLVLVAVGAFGVVMYLYADEIEDHRKTSSSLAVKTADLDLLQQQYTKLIASQEATEAQVKALREESANVQDKFEEASLIASERYRDLRAEQARLIAVDTQRKRLKAELEETQRNLRDARTTYTLLPDPPPVSLAPPPPTRPVASEKEIADAICNTTSFSDPVVEYIHDRVRSIYENGVSLSN